jgi:hypothetical protein
MNTVSFLVVVFVCVINLGILQKGVGREGGKLM